MGCSGRDGAPLPLPLPLPPPLPSFITVAGLGYRLGTLGVPRTDNLIVNGPPGTQGLTPLQFGWGPGDPLTES